MSWYYAKHGRQEGPVTEMELRGMLESAEIAPGDLVWKEGMEDWKPAGEIAELASEPVEAGGGRGGQVEIPSSPGAPAPGGGATPSLMPAQPLPGAPFLNTPPPTSGMAIASMVCGIVAVMMCYVWALAGIPAVICGHVALKAINTSVQPIAGRGMAIAGLVTGYIAIAFQALFVIFIVAAIMANQ